jgi:hypothetical protein
MRCSAHRFISLFACIFPVLHLKAIGVFFSSLNLQLGKDPNVTTLIIIVASTTTRPPLTTTCHCRASRYTLVQTNDQLVDVLVLIDVAHRSLCNSTLFLQRLFFFFAPPNQMCGFGVAGFFASPNVVLAPPKKKNNKGRKNQ